MKNNVKFMKNLVKIVAISVMFVLALAGKSFAADTNGTINLDNLNNLDFENIPNDGSATGQAVTGQGGTTQNPTTTATPEPTTTQTPTTPTTTETKKETKKSSSSSKENIPATGSNVEIIFAIGAVVLVSGAVFVFKKQNIKLK